MRVSVHRWRRNKYVCRLLQREALQVKHHMQLVARICDLETAVGLLKYAECPKLRDLERAVNQVSSEVRVIQQYLDNQVDAPSTIDVEEEEKAEKENVKEYIIISG